MEEATTVLCSCLSKLCEGLMSKLGENLMEVTKQHARYLFCFKRIVGDLMKEEEDLKLAQDRVEQQVERAIRNAEEIEKDVQKWLSDVREVITDVQELKDVVKGDKTCLSRCCPNWGWRYRLSKKAEGKRNVMSNLRDSGNFGSVSHPAILPGIEFLRPKEFELFESAKPVFNQIIEALKDDKTNMVGLYGMGGVGKTTLAKEVGNKVQEKKIFDEVVMVVVSHNSIVNIQDQIAESLGLKLEEKTEVTRAERLYLRFSQCDKKILIILDDVWKKLDLKVTIGISSDDGQNGHKILLTTRLQQVCIAMKCQRKIQLNVLTKKEGLALLKRYADIGEDSPTLNDIATDVASECKGLPLALVTTGSALREKGIDEWKVVFRKLQKSKLEDIHNVDIDIYSCLKLSYDYLKGEETKSCFLLCSLYPEDHNIFLEELVRYGMGLGLYRDVGTIEEARSELRVQVNYLKASCLLLDADNEEFVKMHDIVRDVALGIASKEKKIMVKGGMGFTEWPSEEGMEQCTALLLMASINYELPRNFVYPKLEILILEGDDPGYSCRAVPDNFSFGEMKALKVLSVSGWGMSLKSLHFLTNLRTLHLKFCMLRDMSYLKSLNKLEILDFNGSFIYEFPKQLEELAKLRLLSVWSCRCWGKMPSNIFPRFSRLEELYIDGNLFGESEIEETRDACLSELNSLQHLAILSLDIDTSCLPKNFVFSNLHSYDIRVNEYLAPSIIRRPFFISKHPIKYRTKRILRISDYEATLLFAFQSLYRSVESLRLNHIKGCQNIVPSIDESGFKMLNILELEDCNELRCIIDTSQLNVPATAFCNLGNIVVFKCHNMCSLLPATMVRRLDKLKEVTISSCHKLQEIFQLEGLRYNPGENLVLLSSLEKLKLEELRELRFILKGPINYVSLQSLTDVEVTGCENLTYLFSLSLAQTLVQLKALTVTDCQSLEHLVKKRVNVTWEQKYYQKLITSNLFSSQN